MSRIDVFLSHARNLFERTEVGFEDESENHHLNYVHGLRWFKKRRKPNLNIMNSTSYTKVYKITGIAENSSFNCRIANSFDKNRRNGVSI